MALISAAIVKETQDVEVGLQVTQSNDGIPHIGDQLGRFADDDSNPQLEPGMPIYSINNVLCHDLELSEIKDMIDSSVGIITIIAGDVDTTTNEDDLSSNDGSTMLKTITLAALGWTPNLQRHIQERNRLWIVFLVFLFLVDLVDVIFDTILSARTIVYGSEEGERRLALLLLFATMLGRLLSALYGRTLVKTCTQDASFALLAWMGITIFFLEDGASILLLRKNTDELDFVEGGSIFFTVVSFICYVGYFVVDRNKFMSRNNMSGSPLIGMFVLSAVFQIYILFTQVNNNPSEAPPAMLDILAFTVYSFTAISAVGWISPVLVISGRRRRLLMN